MKIKQDRQYRTIQAMQAVTTEDKLIDSEFYVEGYAMTFDRYKLYDDDEGGVYEKFERNCLDECDMSDVIMRFDHAGRVVARLRNVTLKLVVDDHGLKIGADLSKTEEARSLYEDIRTGMCDAMSFIFAPMPGRYRYDRETRTIIHYGVKKIYEVSAVSIPANEGTEIHTRNFCDGEIAKIRQELLERDRKKLELKIKMEGF